MITNKKIKELVALNQKSKERKKAGLFLAEGIKMFMEAPIDRIREVYVSESFFATKECKEKLEQTGFETVPEETFKKISDTITPQGIICVLKQMEHTFDEMLSADHPVIMVLEDLQDPGNVGTIIRTGEGAGISGVVLTKGSVDIYNPKTIRSTMGSVYRVPFIYVENLSDVIATLKNQGIRTYAAHLKGEAYYDEFDYIKEKGTAFLIGNEGNGLREETAGLADTYLKIPMEGKVESLNAAIAASVLMYETLRQKRQK